MKRKTCLAVLLTLGCLSLSSCYLQRSVSSSHPKNNPDYRVHYLFEHDGCRIYRFYDAWSDSYVYFTTQGDATAICNDSTRRRTATYHQRQDSVFVKKTAE